MKAWIMSIDPFRVSVFQASSNRQEIVFSTVIKNNQPISSLAIREISDGFAQYVAEEIEIACGCGTNSSLILSGNSDDVKKVCQCLSPSLKNNIIGITEKGYCPEVWKGILTLSEKPVYTRNLS